LFSHVVLFNIVIDNDKHYHLNKKDNTGGELQCSK